MLVEGEVGGVGGEVKYRIRLHETQLYIYTIEPLDRFNDPRILTEINTRSFT
jgi:hypothetical protein